MPTYSRDALYRTKQPLRIVFRFISQHSSKTSSHRICMLQSSSRLAGSLLNRLPAPIHNHQQSHVVALSRNAFHKRFSSGIMVKTRKRTIMTNETDTSASSPKRKLVEKKGETDMSSAKHKVVEKEESQSQNHHGFDPYPPSKVYRLIEPGPVLLVTTGSLADSTHNVMTIGFHMVMQHESPPLIGICLGPWDASFSLLKKHRECVLAIPSVEMAALAVDIGNCSASDEDVTSKWDRFGLEALPASRVKAPLVGGSDVIANIECVVEDTKMVSKYSMWVLKPVKSWINRDKMPGERGKMFHHRGDGTFVVDGEVLDLKDRMVKWKEFQN